VEEDLMGFCHGRYEKFWHVPRRFLGRNSWRRNGDNSIIPVYLENGCKRYVFRL